MNDRLDFQIEEAVTRCVLLAEHENCKSEPTKWALARHKSTAFLVNLAILASLMPIVPNGAEGCISNGTYVWCY